MTRPSSSLTELVQTRPRAAWAGACLAALALLLPLMLRPGPAELRAIDGPAALLEMLLPGMLQAGPGGWLLPPGNSVLRPEVTPPFRGHVVALLALFALLAARGRLGGTWRVLTAALLAVFFVWAPSRAELLPWLGPWTAVGAGLALRTLDTRAPDDRGGPGEMLFGGGVLLLAAALALIALRTGAASNTNWVNVLLPAGAAPSDGELRELAAALQRALDFNALSLFVSMAALLWHLKTRSTLTQIVLLAWVSFELSAWPASFTALRRSLFAD
ncbi:MAG: hypothetical protein DHS20C15_22600 [Planctomycetota bacterium]|nr:MAG: hypothetical protein DHS20C15_22600 [Planctomycetota bacterium]